MSSLKSILFFCVFLMAPFVVAAAIAPSIFFGSGSSEPLRVLDAPTSAPQPVTSPEPMPADSSFASVRSDPLLDPVSGKMFLVSFAARFEKLPREDNRQKLIAKYDPVTAPYPGWAFAVHRFESSLRPEVYVRGNEGNGGWFTFETLSLTPGHWYSFSIVYVPQSVLILYAQEFTNEDSTGAPLGPPFFLGGFDMTEVDAPQTVADLFFGGNISSKAIFKGEISRLLIAQADIPNLEPDTILKLISGGPDAIKNRLVPQDVVMWIAGKGKDESQFAREVLPLTKAS